ncbi:MAG: PilN domain-containing protein [Planctomycetes bacterium]|nr:PilN domain-containing protein [Planctomycetota bacterium]
MKHPFDDFLPPSLHARREAHRIVRVGVILVATVSIATAVAFATTLNGWRGLLESRSSVAIRWDDANQRMVAFVKAQKEMQVAMDSAEEIDRVIDSVPRSIILFELTKGLPDDSNLNDIRLETRSRTIEKDKVARTQQITLLGIAPNDATISSYIEALSTSSYFTAVSLMYAQQVGTTTKRNFSIHLAVDPMATLVMVEEQ